MLTDFGIRHAQVRFRDARTYRSYAFSRHARSNAEGQRVARHDHREDCEDCEEKPNSFLHRRYSSVAHLDAAFGSIAGSGIVARMKQWYFGLPLKG
jgi:hypothetical protein